MKTFLVTLLLSPSLLFAQTNGFVVTGNITGLPEGAEVKITSTNDNSLLAKGISKAGAFTIKSAVPEPGLYWLTLGNEQAQHIYLENTDIKVTGSKNDVKNIKIEGSQSQKDFEEFRRIFNPLVGELNAKSAQVQETHNEGRRMELMEDYDSISKKIGEEVGKFVSAKRSSFVSPFLLFITAQMQDDALLMEQRFNMLDEAVRNSAIGKSLADYISYNKVGAVGTEALDFTQNDINGKPVSLSSFRGKYVLLDLWASWCRPCRDENPNVVKAFKKFSNKSFTILGVSLDKEKESWLKAIQKDGLTWTHVSDLQYWSNSVAALYHVTGIPQNFLIDPNGKIVGKNLRGEELEAKLCELLGCDFSEKTNEPK
jgi:peroxiredoxin